MFYLYIDNNSAPVIILDNSTEDDPMTGVSHQVGQSPNTSNSVEKKSLNKSLVIFI